MISHVKLKFGRGPDSSAEEFAASPVTIFVGPNNSGKSRALSEIERFCANGQDDPGLLVLHDLQFRPVSQSRITGSIEQIQKRSKHIGAAPPGHLLLDTGTIPHPVEEAQLRRALAEPYSSMQQFRQWFLCPNTLMIRGGGVGLVSDQTAGDLHRPPESSLQILMRDDAKRQEVRRIVHEAFRTFFVIDPTTMGTLKVRFSQREPASHSEELGLHHDNVRFHSAAQLAEKASDGVKAFTGIISYLIATNPAVALIDEPEAFLHPALANKLAQEIARMAAGSAMSVFVATHSPSFLMGCIQSGTPVSIVRLTYTDAVPAARLLAGDEVYKLMRNPLLRSTNLLSGLFYEFVVVTESDSDRAFYQEVNERLLRSNTGQGIPNCLFINAQNKQTIHVMLRPLRQMGIPAVGIVDIDVLKDGGVVWTKLLEGAGVPGISRQPLGAQRQALKSAMDGSGRDMKRDGGVAVLQGSDREAALDLLEHLGGYGVFVVPGGELESWLKHLGAVGHGSAWLVDIFERMGEDPASPNYVKPSGSDVWDFIDIIRGWLMNPRRKGIPP